MTFSVAVAATLGAGCTTTGVPDGEQTWSIALTSKFAPTSLPTCEAQVSMLEVRASYSDDTTLVAVLPADEERFINHSVTMSDDGTIDLEMSTDEYAVNREDWDIKLYPAEDGAYVGNAIETRYTERNTTRCKSGFNVHTQIVEY